jgi:pyruvate/2-oxoglutarate dehydrogenase complex dihydrolipoamide dehydrogenase (E3) component
LDKPDLLIIGLDPLGLELAMSASALGASVMLAMQGETALEAAHRNGEVLMRLVSMPFDHASDLSRQQDNLARWISVARSPERLRAARVTVEEGRARFLDSRRLSVGERVVSPRRVVIATGLASAEDAGFLTKPLEGMPRRVVISGRSPAGMALALIAMRAQTKTSLVPEAGLLATFDPEISALYLEALERQGLARLAELPTLRPADVPIWQEPQLRPALDQLDLDKAGIRLRDGNLMLNARLETSNGRVSAIGQVTGQSDARMVNYLLARLMFRKAGSYVPPPAIRVVPGLPDLAEIGLTEQEARKRSGRIAIHRANAGESGPVSGPAATVKLVCDLKGRILGASSLAPDAVALMGILSLAMESNRGLETISSLSLPGSVGTEALRLAAGAPQRARLRSPRLQAALRFMRKLG